jgi:hypothetical protein
MEEVVYGGSAVCRWWYAYVLIWFLESKQERLMDIKRSFFYMRYKLTASIGRYETIGPIVGYNILAATAKVTIV